MAGKQTDHRFEINHDRVIGLDYLLYLPPDFDQSKSYPLILFLHGAGERGNDLELVKLQGLAKRLDQGDDLPFIVVSPQCPEDEIWSYYHNELIALLDCVITDYPVDAKRVYLTGLSMGGFGSWDLIRSYPERFAAVAPICGGLYWWIDPAHAAERIKDKPIWVFHGAVDRVVSLVESQRIVDAIEAVNGHVKFTVYPDLDHNSWTVTYDNPALYEWFLAHQIDHG